MIKNSTKKVLLVHGYEIDQQGNPETLARAVCEKIIIIQDKFSHIVLLGGWHRKESPCTIGEAMEKYLLQRGMSPKKVFTRESLGLGNYLPTRDTMEEVDNAPISLRKLGVNPKYKKFWVLGVWFFWPRLWLLYKLRGAKKVRVLGAWGSGTIMPRRILWQIVGLRNLFLDPMGKGDHTVMHRKTRTLEDESRYLANTPETWK
jgi:hypothetical protein